MVLLIRDIRYYPNPNYMKLKKDGFKGQRSIVLPMAMKNVLEENPITSMLYVTDIGYYPHATGHYRNRHSGVDQNILIYCSKGKGYVSINGKKSLVNEGNFFIIEANKPHSYGASSEDPWSIYWVHFTGSKRDIFKSIYNKILLIDHSPEARISDRINIFEEIFQNLEMGYSSDNLEHVSLCLWHFIASFKYIPQYRIINHNAKHDMVQTAIQYMRENLNKKLTLEDLSSHVGYSPSHFGLLFKEKTGESPLNYLCQLKIQRACQMLDMTDMKIKEITQELGFYDQYHFSKTFLKEVGESPTQYKKRVKG